MKLSMAQDMLLALQVIQTSLNKTYLGKQLTYTQRDHFILHEEKRINEYLANQFYTNKDIISIAITPDDEIQLFFKRDVFYKME